MVNLSSVGEAKVFQLPQFMHFGIHFEISACVAIGLLFAINSVQAIGDYSATTIGAMDRVPEDRELQNGIMAYGVIKYSGSIARRTSDSDLQSECWYRNNDSKLSIDGYLDWLQQFLELPESYRNFRHFLPLFRNVYSEEQLFLCLLR